MTSAERDALAHRFIARVLDETRSWPAELQVRLHRIALDVLPEIVLELSEDDARAWAQRWRAQIEREQAIEIPDEQTRWIAESAAEYERTYGPPPLPSAEELERLARLYVRLGPLALSLPWRGDPRAKA
jgi:hypothetical protein